MRTIRRLALLHASLLAWIPSIFALPGLLANGNSTANVTEKNAFISNLIQQMAIGDLVLQLHLMFGDNIVGPNSDNALYDFAMSPSPTSPVGNVHDWYPMNQSHYNSLQQLNLQKSHLKVPFMHIGECLHGVGSFNQSIFPQNIGMAASFDTDIVHRTARAIGAEARSIGLHACLAPVLDLAQDPRWGRAQEDFGEDKLLTSHMGVAYASGLSKNSTWSDPDAVVPVMKHFAAHGSPQSGHNTAPFMGHGNRQVISELLTPFRAAVELGGVRGVMMAYSEVDDIPSSVNPMLYQALQDWDYDGFVIADDTGMSELQYVHEVAASPADAIGQWFNAGGMIQYYDYSLGIFLNATKGLVSNNTVNITTLQSHVRKILGVKWDLGLFDNPFIPEDIDPHALVDAHADVAIEASHKSIVLLENRNSTLPLQPTNLKKIALIGPFSDVFNFGDYSGTWGSYPVHHASTIRQGILEHLKNSSVELVSSWGTNTWRYNNQYVVPPYLLSSNGTTGGLLATYYANMNFTNPLTEKLEAPVLDWGLYPPPGSPSNNFSVVWEGELESPTSMEVDGWIGVAISPNSTASLYIDGSLVYHSEMTSSGSVITNIEPFSYIEMNSTISPPNSAPFTFQPNVSYHVRIEFAAQNTYQKFQNVNSVNAQVIFFWNLVNNHNDSITQASLVASDADAIVLAVGGAWNSDAENGDRGTLELAPNQMALAEAMFELGKPVVTVIQGGRPFAIPDIYNRSSAVLSTYFPGQAGGQAIADVLFGAFNPGGRLPMSVPRSVGQLPVYYNYKPTAHLVPYLDIESAPCYSFGYGKSYTTFQVTEFAASASSNSSFTAGDTITFTAKVTNSGMREGSYVVQVYTLQRASQIVQPVKQLVAFTRVYLDAGKSTTASAVLDVDRYLSILNRKNEWELEKGAYYFALLDHGGWDADTSMNITMQCV